MNFDVFLVRKSGEIEDTGSIDCKDINMAIDMMYNKFGNKWQECDNVVVKQDLPNMAEGFAKFELSCEGVRFHPDEYDAARKYAENTASCEPYPFFAVLVGGKLKFEDIGQYVDDINLEYFLVMDKGKLESFTFMDGYEGEQVIDRDPTVK